MNKQEYPDKVLQQQEAIRSSGMINMFDKEGVKQIAEDMGSDELVDFIENASADEYMDMANESVRQYR